MTFTVRGWRDGERVPVPRGESRCPRCHEVRAFYESEHSIEDCIRELTERMERLAEGESHGE